MSKYTIELGELVKSGFAVFDNTWCTFSPEHKSELCDKIVRHYWFNEIGAETPERFKHYINEHLSLIMPRYNQLYRSELWELFPLYNHILETQQTNAQKSTGTKTAGSRRDASSLISMGRSLYHELQSDEWKKFDGLIHSTESKIGNLTGNHTTNTAQDTTGTEDYTKHQDNKLTENSTRNITENTTSKEIVDDDTTNKTTGNETTSKTASQWSSDTPQGKVVNGDISIDGQYLTNYSHSTENGSRNYTDSQTGTDDKTTDFTQDKTTQDTFDRTVNEDNTETLDKDTSSHSTTNTRQDDVEDTTGYSDATTTTDNTDHDNKKDNAQDFENQTTQSNSSDASSSAEDTIAVTDGSTYSTVKGTIGASRVDLLVKFREAVINVDEMIIKDLAIDFMGVF